jgi:transposase
MNMEIVIPPEDSVRLLSQLMEELDYRKLYEAYSRTGRKAALSPMNLFKIMVYGYMNLSLRGIAETLELNREMVRTVKVSKDLSP